MAQKIMTAVGNAQIDTDITDAFGGVAGAGLFDGAGDWLTTLDSDDWSFFGSDFSIDFWVYFNAFSNNNYYNVLGQEADANNLWWIWFDTQGTTDHVGLFQYETGYKVSLEMAAGTNFATGQWYHIAFARTGTTSKAFINGVAQTLSQDSFATAANLASVLYVGGRASASAGDPLNGWMDELRISKGTNLIGTSDFTPSTVAYGYSASNVLLLHMDGDDASTTFTDDSATLPSAAVKSMGFIFG